MNERPVSLVSPSVIFLGGGSVNERPVSMRSPTLGVGVDGVMIGLEANNGALATTGVGAAAGANLATGAAETTGLGAAHGAAYDMVVGAKTTIVGEADSSGGVTKEPCLTTVGVVVLAGKYNDGDIVEVLDDKYMGGLVTVPAIMGAMPPDESSIKKY